jgi:PAS domain S-box-containing protein
MKSAVTIKAMTIPEEERIKSEETYRLLFNSNPSPIFIVDQISFQIWDANIMALKLFGYQKPGLIGKTFFDLVSEDYHEILSQVFREKKTFLGKLKQKNKKGSTFYVNLRCSSGVYGDKSVYIIMTNDITDQMQAEQQLAHAGKMATLGELSAGVAHELNQPLTVIKTGSNFILRKIRNNQPISEENLKTLAEEIDAQVDRASRIINHMREFGRKTEILKTSVQVNEAINGMLTVIGGQLELRRIKLLLDLDPELPRILGDQNRLEQIFINLAMNARDALDDPSITEKIIRIRSFFENGWVKIDFTDNGCGIPKENQEKIFEPFFSTKGVGQGTGLGLSISYGIIRDYQGQIQVNSRMGSGTSFILQFPALKFKDEPKPE